MTVIEIIKLIWRQILATRELKEAFFHRTEALIKQKKYDRLFRKCHNSGAKMLYYYSEIDLLYIETIQKIHVTTNKEYSVFLEVFIDNIYALPPQIMRKEFYLFDVGMNRGYASLYFANMPNCKKVFGFEIDENTYNWAIRNFELNEHLKKKISPFNFGLWDKTEEVEICSCGSDGLTSVNNLSIKYDAIKKMQDKTSRSLKKALVRQASFLFNELFIETEHESLKILKIDIEGAEYSVFEDLSSNNVLERFHLIIGECHNGLEDLQKHLTNFSCLFKDKEKGTRISFCFVNKNIQSIF
ncbi:MAG: FkbM family methyltransferase [Bacteroidales bacterium]|nr:FkbM family methyltransferase [Bacteroidales bacterium]